MRETTRTPKARRLAQQYVDALDAVFSAVNRARELRAALTRELNKSKGDRREGRRTEGR